MKFIIQEKKSEKKIVLFMPLKYPNFSTLDISKKYLIGEVKTLQVLRDYINSYQKTNCAENIDKQQIS